MLESHAPGLWTTDTPLRFLGLEVGARMTIVRLPDESLFLHSPVAAAPALVEAVAALGEVSAIVAPNRLHHLFAGEWIDACPSARFYAAPGLEKKRSDLRIDGVLGDSPEPQWKGAIEQVAVQGFPFANEVVFFHEASATLILTDIAFHLGDEAPPLTRLFIRMTGQYGKLAPTMLEKMLIRDREGFATSLRRILAWPFERVVVAHGRVLETGGREALASGYAWLLDRTRA